MSEKLQGGDLVSIEPWDCEGIEPPWGWTSGDERKRVMESNKSYATKISRKKLIPGVSGLVIELDHLGVNDFDTHYVVLINGQKLSIPVRFLHKLQS